jgi:CheY-like chemotaxis protein
MNIVLLTQDLMIGARVEGATRQLGLTMQNVSEQQAAISAAEDTACQVLLVDLRTPGLDITALVQAIRTAHNPSLPIVACGPHVHEANLAAATAAGCDAVITRGQLDREISAILAKLVTPE